MWVSPSAFDLDTVRYLEPLKEAPLLLLGERLEAAFARFTTFNWFLMGRKTPLLSVFSRRLGIYP